MADLKPGQLSYDDIKKTMRIWGTAYSVDPNLMLAIAMQEVSLSLVKEENGEFKTVRNQGAYRSKGTSLASGLMQFMPATANSSGISVDTKNKSYDDRLVDEKSIFAAADLISELNTTFHNNIYKVIAAYHTGPTNVSLAINQYVNQNNMSVDKLSENDIYTALKGFRFQNGKKLTDGSKMTCDYMREVYSKYLLLKGMSPIEAQGNNTSGVTAIQPKRILDYSSSNGRIDYGVINEMMNKDKGNNVTIYDNIEDPDYFKVGDVILKVSPQQISFHEENMIQEFPTVRTFGSPKVSTGMQQITINASCIFSTIDEINGYYVDYGTTKKYHSGLIGMIAQFYRAPFLPIENKVVRMMLIPRDKPNILEGGSKADIIASVTNEIKLYSEIINGMGKNSTFSDYASNQINMLNNYKRVVEEIAETEKDIIGIANDKMKITDTPLPYDDVPIAVVLDSFSLSTVSGMPHAIKAMFTFRPFNYTPFSNDFSFVITEDDAVLQASSYQNLLKDPTVKISPDVKYTYNISNSEVYKNYYMAIIDEFQKDSESSVYKLPPSVTTLGKVTGDPYENIKFNYIYTTRTQEQILASESELMKQAIELITKQTQDTGVRKVDPPNWFFERWWRYSMAAISLSINGLSLVTKGITGMYDQLQNKIDPTKVNNIIWNPIKMQWQEAGKYLAEQLKDVPVSELIKMTEDLIIQINSKKNANPFISDTIDLNSDDTIITGISSSFQNKVTPLYTVSNTFPTFQYMGGSDVTFSMTVLTTDEQLLTNLRLMAMRCTYTSILSSRIVTEQFIDNAVNVEGDFFKMLGVNRVVVGDMVYSTSEEHPGLYEIQMSLIQADMDLKKYESIMAADANVTTQIVTDAFIHLLNADKNTSATAWAGGSVWGDYHNRLMVAFEKIFGDDKVTDIAALSNALRDLTKMYGSLLPRKVGEQVNNVAYITAGRIMAGSVAAALGITLSTGWTGVGLLLALGVLAGGAVAAIVNTLIERSHKGEDEERKRITEGFIELAQTRIDIIRSLSNDNDITQLNSPDIKKQLNDLKKTTVAYNQCYGDMNLPVLFSSPLNTPADFFYKRDEIITNDTITRQLAEIDKTRINKLIGLLNINFKEGDEISKQFLNDYKELCETLDNINNVRPEDVQALLSKFSSRYSCTLPAHVLDTAKTITSAAMVESLTKQITSLEKDESTFNAALESAANKIGISESQKAEYNKRRQEEYAYLIKDLKRQKASYQIPGMNTINTTGEGYGIIHDIYDNSYYGQAFQEAETTVIERLALETRKKDQTLHMARAYPAYKLYFIEKDKNEWRLFDDFYSYSAIKSVEISESKKSASKTAIIKLSNISGRLNDPLADGNTESYGASDTVNEQHIDSLMLRVGCGIMIRLGYDNNPLNLEMSFHGAISQLKPGDGEIEIIAQSWGAKLNDPITGKQTKVGWYDTRKAHGDIITWAMEEVGGLQYMGNRSIFDDIDDPIRQTIKDSILDVILKNITGLAYPNNPRDDNILLPYNSSWNPTTKWTFDWTIDGGETIWELINEVLLYYPDYIVTILPYYPDPDRLFDQRYTLYIGPAAGYYKWTDAYPDDWKKYLENIKLITEEVSSFNNIKINNMISNRTTVDLGKNPDIIPFIDYDAFYNQFEPYIDDEYVYLARKVGSTLKVGRRFGLYDWKLMRELKGTGAVVNGHADLLKRTIDLHTDTGSTMGDNDMTIVHEAAHILTPEWVYNLESQQAEEDGGVFYDDCPTENIARGVSLWVFLKRSIGAGGSQGKDYSKLRNAVYNNRSGGFISDNCVMREPYVIAARDVGITLDLYRSKDGKIWSDLEFKMIVSIGGQICNILDEYKSIYGHKRESWEKGVNNTDDQKYQAPGILYNAYGKILPLPRISGSDSTDNSVKGRDAITDKIRKHSPPPTVVQRASHINPADPELFYGADGKLLKCFKPVTAYHFYDSDHHILGNSIAASVDNMYNKVTLVYPGKPGSVNPEPVFSYEMNKFNNEYSLVADDDIPPDYIKTYISYQKNIDTNIISNYVLPFVLGKASTGGTSENPEGEGIPVYMRVANTILNNMMKEMYDGWLTVVGDASVKPYDKVFMYDFQNDMYGPFEVDTVIHRFSMETGFVTEIKPSLISHCQNFSQTLNEGYLNHMYTWSVINGIKEPFMGLVSPFTVSMGSKYASRGIKKGLNTIASRNVTFAKGELAVFEKIAVPLKYASKAFLPLMVAWTLYDVAKGMGMTFNKELGKLMGRQAINITPLTYGGLPLVAGCEGWRTDDMWVHIQDNISSIKNLPQYFAGVPS